MITSTTLLYAYALNYSRPIADTERKNYTSYVSNDIATVTTAAELWVVILLTVIKGFL